MAVAHLALQLGARHQCRHRVDDDDVDRTRAHQHFHDLQRLLAGVGLRDQQVVEVHAELGRVDWIERVLGVDEGRHARGLLRLRHRLQRERGLARGFRAVDLDDAALGQASDAERGVHGHGAGRDHVSGDARVALSHAEDGALAVVLLDLAQRRVKIVLCCLFHWGSPFSGWLTNYLIQL